MISTGSMRFAGRLISSNIQRKRKSRPVERRPTKKPITDIVYAVPQDKFPGVSFVWMQHYNIVEKSEMTDIYDVLKNSPISK